jgi:SSS family solute:Na+ symporter
VVSYATKPLPESQLVGLVYGCTEIPHDGGLKLWQTPKFWAIVIAMVLVILNILVW